MEKNITLINRGAIMEYLNLNLIEVREKIEVACKKANRSIDEVTLIAVTKTIDESIVNESIKMGITDIGENKVQEIQRKFDNITPGVKWHLIGHLQRNKVKYIIDKVAMIHSVDSLRLAEEINKRAEGIGIVMDILIQLNISNEETKFGIDIEALKEMLNEMKDMKHIRIKGLMTMAPYYDNPEEARWIFRKMKDIFEELKYNEFNNVSMEYLSMGMTNDYDIAIEEGASLVRIGTGIYGPRNYDL